MFLILENFLLFYFCFFGVVTKDKESVDRMKVFQSQFIKSYHYLNTFLSRKISRCKVRFPNSQLYHIKLRIFQLIAFSSVIFGRERRSL